MYGTFKVDVQLFQVGERSIGGNIPPLDDLARGGAVEFTVGTDDQTGKAVGYTLAQGRAGYLSEAYARQVGGFGRIFLRGCGEGRGKGLEGDAVT